MDHAAANKKMSTGKLLRQQSLREILSVLENERVWTEHYVWYLSHVLSKPETELTELDHERRRKIESLVPQARLAQWAEIADSPQELENLFSWMQGRLDLAEHLTEQFQDLQNGDDAATGSSQIS